MEGKGLQFGNGAPLTPVDATPARAGAMAHLQEMNGKRRSSIALVDAFTALGTVRYDSRRC